MFRSLTYIFGYFAILHQCNCVGTKKTVPVFLMDHENVMSHLTLDANPFHKMESEHFTGLVLDAMKRTECVIIFAEETLSTEDFSLRDNFGSPFVHLRQGIKNRTALYMPAVFEPYESLRTLFEPRASNVFRLGSGEKLRLVRKYKYLYINFKDNPEMSRLVVLRKHDAIMNEVYSTVRQLKTGPIVAFYTGKMNPIEIDTIRYVRKPEAVKQELTDRRGVMVTTADALFRFDGVYVSRSTRRSTFEQAPFVDYAHRTRRSLTTNMQYSDFHLQFNFEFGHTNWKLANVVLMESGQEVGRTVMDITAPWGKSYYCPESIAILNRRDGSSVVVSQYQIEPISEARRAKGRSVASILAHNPTPFWRPMDFIEFGWKIRSTSTTFRPSTTPFPQCWFSQHVHCSPYFSSIMISSVLLGLVFLAVMSVAVGMLYNTGTNNKFDDPQKEPIVIAFEDK